MNDIDFLAEELYRRYGYVKRARGPFLYTQSGARLTDMYQEGGRAILGWSAGGSYKAVKNALDRGAVGSYKTAFSGRLSRAVSSLFEGGVRDVFVFSRKDDCLAAALSLSPEGTFFWKPWAPGAAAAAASAPCIAFAPPFPWAPGLFILAARRELTAGAAPPARAVRLASPLEAGVSRAVYDLRAALRERGEADFALHDRALSPYWERRGPYLTPRVRAADYRAFALHCLALGIVISPRPGEESIVPYGADAGVLRALERNPFVYEEANNNENK